MRCTFSLLISGLLMLSLPSYGQLRTIKTIAGDGVQGYSGDGLAATAADCYGPISVALDPSGNVYFVDYFNIRVRKVNVTTGVITTVAGTGSGLYTGDSSLATSAGVDPQGIAFDKHGNMYIADGVYSVIRKVNTLGIITTIAGNGTHGYSGDHGPARAASFGAPRGIAVDTFGNIFVADATNNVVRMINTLGIITTVAGNDTVGYSGDGFPAVHARLDSPYAVAVDRSCNLFIADYNNDVIRKVDDTGGISTYAGSGTYGYYGNGGPATAAGLDHPSGIALDTLGNLYIADSHNNVIRMVNPSGVISTVVGDGSYGFGGDLGDALGANMKVPFGVATDIYGSIYIADADNERIREAYLVSLGVNSVSTAGNVDMFPNPSSNKVTLSSLSVNDKVCVFDVLGRQVGEPWTAAADGVQTFNIQSLATGVYVLQVFDANGNKKAVAQLVKE